MPTASNCMTMFEHATSAVLSYLHFPDNASTVMGMIIHAHPALAHFPHDGFRTGRKAVNDISRFPLIASIVEVTDINTPTVTRPLERSPRLFVHPRQRGCWSPKRASYLAKSSVIWGAMPLRLR
jgi:hypothetical protein